MCKRDNTKPKLHGHACVCLVLIQHCLWEQAHSNMHCSAVFLPVVDGNFMLPHVFDYLGSVLPYPLPYPLPYGTCKLTSTVQSVWCICWSMYRFLHAHVQANCLQSGGEKTGGRTL